MARIREVVFDCATPSRLARFWAAVLDGYRVRPYAEAEVARLAAAGFTPLTDPTVLVDGGGPTLCFQRVPGRVYTGNRLHLDIEVAEPGAEVVRLCALGAVVQRQTPDYTVMHDPEGNQFCVVGAKTYPAGER